MVGEAQNPGLLAVTVVRGVTRFTSSVPPYPLRWTTDTS